MLGIVSILDLTLYVMPYVVCSYIAKPLHLMVLFLLDW